MNAMGLIKRLVRDRFGTSAVEFAIVAPVFLMILLTFIGFGIYLTVATAIQQVAADAARAAVAGLTAIERSQLATTYITKTTLDYPMIDPSKLKVAVASDPLNSEQFTVSLEYDATNLPIFSLYSFMIPDKHIRRFSTIRVGGI